MSGDGISAITYFITQSDFLTMLSLKHHFRSTAIWEENDPDVLKARGHYHMHGWLLHGRVRPTLSTPEGLQDVSHLGTVKIDQAW